ncbi:MAG: hypothetical protein QXJ75_03835 [Candidatus Bathyarchaeia archaeon]
MQWVEGCLRKKIPGKDWRPVDTLQLCGSTFGSTLESRRRRRSGEKIPSLSS